MDKYWIIIALLIVVIGGGLYYGTTMPSKYDDLAKCIAAKQAKFYGAFWCPHCKEQKDAFGASSKYLPYIECSTPDGQNQLQECITADITSYPTWVFADGSRLKGPQTLATLATKTSCTVEQSG